MLLRTFGVIGFVSLFSWFGPPLGTGISAAHAAQTSGPGEDAEHKESTPSREELASYLAMPKHVRWQTAAHLFVDGPESCVDGRDQSTVVGAPGGDAGEFILSLSVIERLTGHSFSQPEVDELLSQHIASFGGFYMHTDEHAQQFVIDQLARDSSVPQGVPHERLLRYPPPSLQDRLLEILIEPGAIGCGHLRLIATRSSDYDVRPELVHQVLRAFYRNLWREQPGMRLVVLEGDHRERAVVTVHVPGPLHPFSKIPLIEPRDGQFEMFVYHPEVTEWLRREHGAFFLENLPWLAASVEEKQLDEALSRSGQRHLTLTIEALAANLPKFDVVSSAHGLEVRQVAARSRQKPARRVHKTRAAGPVGK